jgi:hypothetical protein
MVVCIGKDKKRRTFEVDIAPDDVVADALLHVRVSPPPIATAVRWFDLVLRQQSPGIYRIDMIQRNAFGGMGIPDTVIPELCRRLAVTICSSVKSAGSEYRTEDADKMWSRLVSHNLARYIEGEDRFVCSE